MRPPPITYQLDVRAYGTGASRDIAAVQQQAESLWNVYTHTRVLTYRATIVAEKFHALSNSWRTETRFESSLTKITEHPAYREIIMLGDEVLPLLLQELRYRPEPEFWFTALRQITGADPVPVNHRGNLRAMANDWLRWGREHRIIR